MRHRALLGAGIDTSFNPFAVGWHCAVWADDPDWVNPGDGNTVETWTDGTGNGRSPTQAIPGARPIFRSSVAALNGKAAVDFDGVNNVLKSSSFAGQANPTIIWIGMRDGNGTGNDQRIVDVSLSPSYTELFMKGGYYAAYSGSTKLSTTALDIGVAHAIRLRYTSGPGMVMSVDGVESTFTGAAGDSAVYFALSSWGAGDYGNVHTAFAAIYVGDVTADPAWAKFVSWASTFYGLAIS